MNMHPSLRSLRTLGAPGIITASLLLILVSPALAYPPPCARGDLYVGADAYEHARCIERRFLKVERAQKARRADMVQRVFRGKTTRTLRRNARGIYLHPTRRNLIREVTSLRSNIVDRNFPEKAHLWSVYFPVITGTQQVALARQDTSAEAMLSFRTRRAEMKQTHRESPKVRTKGK